MGIYIIAKPSVVKELEDAYRCSPFQLSGLEFVQDASDAVEKIELADPSDMFFVEAGDDNSWKQMICRIRERDRQAIVCIPKIAMDVLTEATRLGAVDLIIGKLTPERLFLAYQKNISDEQIVKGGNGLYWHWTWPMMLERFFADLMTGRIPASPMGLTEVTHRLKHSELMRMHYYLVLMSYEAHCSGAVNWEYLITEYTESLLSQTGFTVQRVMIDFHRSAFVLYCALTEGKNMEDEISKLCRSVVTAGKQEVGSCINFFVSDRGSLSDMPSLFKRLEKMQKEFSGIGQYNHVVSMSQKGQFSEHSSGKASSWAMMLTNGMIGETEAQILAEINTLEAAGKSDPPSRNRLIEQVMMACTWTLHDKQVREQAVFGNDELAQLFTTAKDSWPDMRRYIHKLMAAMQDTLFPQNLVATVVERAKAYIDQNIGMKLERETIASNVYVSVDYLSRVFRKSEGINLSAYIMNKKIDTAKELLKSTTMPITTIAEELSFSSPAHFCSTFRKYTGMPPAIFRRENT